MPFWQFFRKGWDGHALLVQPSISAHRKWPEMIVSASTNQVWTKITIRSYAWSFGHSDPDPSNVKCTSWPFPIIKNRIEIHYSMLFNIKKYAVMYYMFHHSNFHDCKWSTDKSCTRVEYKDFWQNLVATFRPLFRCEKGTKCGDQVLSKVFVLWFYSSNQ